MLNETTLHSIGKTIQNVVFKTERKYGDTIQNLGRNKLDAVLVDTKRSLDKALTTLIKDLKDHAIEQTPE